MVLGLGAWLAVSVLASPPGLEAGDTAEETPATTVALFRAAAGPLIEQHCLACHSGADAEVGLDLHALLRGADQPPSGPALEQWAAVLERLAEGTMPPEDAEVQPSDTEVVLASAALDQQLEVWRHQRAARAPQAVVSRLGRTEYGNAIRDLLGVHIDTRRFLPPDDVGYGFDHIGSVLSLPPPLFERYVLAAEHIAERVIEDDDPRFPPTRHIAGHRLQVRGSARATASGAVRLTSRAEVLGRFDIRRDGIYRIRVLAYGEQAGPEVARLAVRVGGTDFGTHAVPATREEPMWIDVGGRLDAGTAMVGVAFVNDYYNPGAEDRSQRDRNLVILAIEVKGPIGSIPGRRHAAHRAFVGERPESAGDIKAAATEVFARFLPRAFRRPVGPEEVASFVKLIEQEIEAGTTYEGALRTGLMRALVSPSFLFHTERGTRRGAVVGVQPVDEWALASRLAFFIWGSVPDEALLDAAARGELRRDLATHVARMRADPRFQNLADNFLAQWLQLGRLEDFSPDPKRFPEFDATLRADLLAEAQAFLRSWVEEDRPLGELLATNRVFVNERLARHYGLPRVAGATLRSIELKGPALEQRGGLLGLGAVQALTAYPTRTSPVMRGKWVLEQLLDEAPPPPPPGVGTLEDLPGIDPRLPVRARLARHREERACAACHERMDAIGLALEPYDAIGRWRTHNEHGHRIDASGQLGGRAFRGPGELRRILLAGEAFPRAFVRHLLVFALGRGLDPVDEPHVRAILAQARPAGYRMSALLDAVVRSRPFDTTRVIAPEPAQADGAGRGR